MPKTDFILRSNDSDISDLKAIHQKYFPGNQLAVWRGPTQTIIKVANGGELTGYATLDEAKKAAGYVEPQRPQ